MTSSSYINGVGGPSSWGATNTIGQVGYTPSWQQNNLQNVAEEALKSIEKITSQQVINDFRNFVIRYEGDLYNNNTNPIGLHNKVWINFGTSTLQEPVSCYIDGMT